MFKKIAVWLLCACILTQVSGAMFTTVAHAATTSTTYYVDCTAAGSDSAAGTSPTTAWSSLTFATNRIFAPGDQLLLKRGCSWTGPLKLRKQVGTASDPIRISAYGSGDLPIIQNTPLIQAYQNAVNVDISESRYLVLDSLATRHDAWKRESGCNNQPVGEIYGFRIYSGDHITIQNVRSTEQTYGIYINTTAHHNRILHNDIRDNTMMFILTPATTSSTQRDDSGAVGIAINGNDNEVAYNTITGQRACSYDYGVAGKAIELFHASRNTVHHNQAIENNYFVELGKNAKNAAEETNDNTFAYNEVRSSSPKGLFLVTRGAKDTKWGPVERTRVYNNTVYLSGAESYAVQCTGGCSTDILTMKNNIIWAEGRIGFSDGAFNERYNLYWRSPELGAPRIFFKDTAGKDIISSTSQVADPTFVDRFAGILSLKQSSPAIDAGTSESVSAGYDLDLSSMTVPQRSSVDIGAWEYSSAILGEDNVPAPVKLESAVDSFSRATSGAWGNANTGGAYTLFGTASDYSVASGTGLIRIPKAGNTRIARLEDVSARDVGIRVRVRTDKTTSGDGQFAFVIARHSGADTEYRGKLRFDASNRVFLHVTRVVDGREEGVGKEVLTDLRQIPNTYVELRMSVTGTFPTTLRLKAWPDGEPEPTTWQYVQTDATSALQYAGAAGLRAYISGNTTNAPVQFTFDDFTVTETK